MTNRMVAIIFIFICSAIAWTILGSTIFVRTNTASNTLNGQVQSIWGAAQVQSPPTAAYTVSSRKAAGLTAGGAAVGSVEQKHADIQLPIQASLVNVDIAVDY